MSPPDPGSRPDLLALEAHAFGDVDALRDPAQRPPPARQYTPGSEPPAVLEARTVGRDEVIRAMDEGIARLLRGESPHHLYLFGPRGVGKSHLLALGRSHAQLAEPRGQLRVRVIPEDMVSPAHAEELWARMVPVHDLPPWMLWERTAEVEVSTPTVILLDGLDKHLGALSPAERKALRALLQAHPRVWIVGAGARLSSVFIEQDEAFYGGFRAVPVGGLADADAATLLERLVGDDALAHPRWQARRDALVTLAGGNPRALVALAQAVGSAPGELVATRLLSAVDEFTPHYQLRMRDLAPNEQRLIDLLTTSPRLLGPSEVASILGGVPATWSTAANRLSDDGVLTIQQEGKFARYRITEPLFRYWLEFRTATPERTRIAWLSQLLERVLGPDEMVSTWRESDDPAVQDAVFSAMRRNPSARRIAWAGALPELQAAVRAGEPTEIQRHLASAVNLCPSEVDAWELLVLLSPTPKLAAQVASALDAHRCTHLAQLARALAGQATPRSVLSALLTEGRGELERIGVFQRNVALDQARVLDQVFTGAVLRIDPRGQPWRLRPHERTALAAVPWLRSRFYRHGRRTTHPPLLDEANLLAAALHGDDADLPDLLWTAMVRRHLRLANRIVELLDASTHPRLPWCPWPGRLLALDAQVLLRVAMRAKGREPLLWAAAFEGVDEVAFGHWVESLRVTRPPAPPPRQAGSFELALARVARGTPDRYLGLRAALGDLWAPVFIGVDILVAQLAQAEKGPLHPELARVDQALRSTDRL
ncbi:ATP-binding protein [Myxococcota bacterium]|nr:ATP-binding protein [Myxococcota bacterium]